MYLILDGWDFSWTWTLWPHLSLARIFSCRTTPRFHRKVEDNWTTFPGFPQLLEADLGRWLLLQKEAQGDALCSGCVGYHDGTWLCPYVDVQPLETSKFGVFFKEPPWILGYVRQKLGTTTCRRDWCVTVCRYRLCRHIILGSVRQWSWRNFFCWMFAAWSGCYHGNPLQTCLDVWDMVGFHHVSGLLELVIPAVSARSLFGCRSWCWFS